MTPDNDFITVENALNTMYNEDYKLTGSYKSVGFQNLVIVERYIRKLENKYMDMITELYEDHEDTEDTEDWIQLPTATPQNKGE